VYVARQTEISLLRTLRSYSPAGTVCCEYKLFADCCGLGYLTRSHIKRFAHDMIHGAEMYVDFIPNYHEKKRQIEEEKTAKKNQDRKRPRPYQPAHY